MCFQSRSLRPRIVSQLGLSLVFASLPTIGWAQAAAAELPAHANIISVSPGELFYKTQLGYERRLGQRNAVGVQAGYHYGTMGGHRGWQATGYYRRFLTGRFPTGFYVQAQASLFNFSQTANLIEVRTKKPFSIEYQALSAGGGFGFGYRGRLLQHAFGGRLLYSTLLGLRFQHLPHASYDALAYYPDSGFLGETDAANWHLGFGPGTLAHGLLTLDYQL